ncbi:MAG: hypothetical protein J6V21_08670 [Alistipes sp.]|nr:hypothetical protein [Alistipes sp.]
MIHEEICTYEVCKLAKEKGFNVQTFDWYDYTGNYHKGFVPHELYECPRYKEYYAPTQSLLQRWLREQKGIIVEVFVDDDSNMPLTYNIHQYKDWNWECVCHHHGNYYAVTNWELCLEDALKYALDNLVI